MTTRIPDSASSAVVVLRAIVSWTWVLTRWSGRPNTMATAIRAGASSSTMNSSVGLRVNRMMIEPTSPMTADSRLVTVWVSIVRTSVTSLDSRDTSSPTRRRGVEVERQGHEPPEQVAPELGDDPLPHHPEQVRLQEAADGLDAEQHEQDDDQAVEPRCVATGHDLGRDPGDDQREGEPDERRDDEPDERDREATDVRVAGTGTGAPMGRRRSRGPRGRPRPRPPARARTAGSWADQQRASSSSRICRSWW